MVAVVVAAGIGVVAFVNIRGDLGSAPNRSGVDWGTAGTILGGTSGFTVHVTSVQRTEPIDSHDYAVLELVFANTSPSQQRADPIDFTLLAGGGSARQPIFVAHSECAEWPLTDLYPNGDAGQPLRDAGGNAAGRMFGPVTLCFSPPPARSPLTLVWDPDVSVPILDSPTRIPLQ